MVPFTPPTFELEAFNCPNCMAYAAQTWRDTYGILSGLQSVNISNLKNSKCAHCGEVALWWKGKLAIPDKSAMAPPNPDLDAGIRADYEEAGSVLNRSPRSCAALLRLALQKLCKQLGQPGKNINDDIAALVKQGLPTQLQQSLDVLRVVGNNAVHPGELDLRDDRKTAIALFGLINLIAEDMITQPKKVQAMYDQLPAGAKQAIAVRDK